jgi:hypothetical protein
MSLHFNRIVDRVQRLAHQPFRETGWPKRRQFGAVDGGKSLAWQASTACGFLSLSCVTHFVWSAFGIRSRHMDKYQVIRFSTMLQPWLIRISGRKSYFARATLYLSDFAFVLHPHAVRVLHTKNGDFAYG